MEHEKSLGKGGAIHRLARLPFVPLRRRIRSRVRRVSTDFLPCAGGQIGQPPCFPTREAGGARHS